MKATYWYQSNLPWFSTQGDVKILKTTEKSIFVDCDGITLRLRRSEIISGAKITRSGYHESSDFYIVVTVVEAEE